MKRPVNHPTSEFARNRRPTLFDNWRMVNVVLQVACVLILMFAPAAHGQTLKVLHTFSGPDGLSPYSGVTMDRAGNLYGTTYAGGSTQLGTVYELKRSGSNYTHNQLHVFTGGNDGEQPYGGVVFGPDGALYGTTWAGGASGAGTAFALRPQASFCRTVLCPCIERVCSSISAPIITSIPRMDRLCSMPPGISMAHRRLAGAANTAPSINSAVQAMVGSRLCYMNSKATM